MNAQIYERIVNKANNIQMNLYESIEATIHNHEVGSSILPLATLKMKPLQRCEGFLFYTYTYKHTYFSLVSIKPSTIK